MKIEIIAGTNCTDELQDEVNDFIKDKKVIDIKQSISCTYECKESDGLLTYDSAVHYRHSYMVMYED